MQPAPPSPTYRKEKSKESRHHMTTRTAETTVTIFIINCLHENSNDFATCLTDGNCKCAISMASPSSAGRAVFRASAAANASATPPK